MNTAITADTELGQEYYHWHHERTFGKYFPKSLEAIIKALLKRGIQMSAAIEMTLIW
ncbi:MAG: hypothetical protein WBO95_09500 [Candidatus Dechloromonas phosphoritropha]